MGTIWCSVAVRLRASQRASVPTLGNQRRTSIPASPKAGTSTPATGRRSCNLPGWCRIFSGEYGPKRSLGGDVDIESSRIVAPLQTEQFPVPPGENVEHGIVVGAQMPLVSNEWPVDDVNRHASTDDLLHEVVVLVASPVVVDGVEATVLEEVALRDRRAEVQERRPVAGGLVPALGEAGIDVRLWLPKVGTEALWDALKRTATEHQIVPIFGVSPDCA